jgi:hypothetical protein
MKLPETLARWMDYATESAQHRRTPEIIAHLQLGFFRYLQFAQSIGSITEEKALELQEDSWKALGEAAGAQYRHQKSEDPVGRFLELIRSALSTYNAHLGGCGLRHQK